MIDKSSIPFFKGLTQHLLDRECPGFSVEYEEARPFINNERYVLSFDCGYYTTAIAYSANPFALLEYAMELVSGPDGWLWEVH